VVADGDTWLNEQDPSKNYGTTTTLILRSQANQNHRVLVRFPLPEIPEGCSVSSATLTLAANSSASGRTIDAYRATASWTETGATWSNQPSIDTSAKASAASALTLNLNVTSLVATMYGTANYGFSIRDSAEGGSGFEQQWFSREEVDPQKAKPQLVVDWS